MTPDELASVCGILRKQLRAADAERTIAQIHTLLATPEPPPADLPTPEAAPEPAADEPNPDPTSSADVEPAAD